MKWEFRFGMFVKILIFAFPRKLLAKIRKWRKFAQNLDKKSKLVVSNIKGTIKKKIFGFRGNGEVHFQHSVAIEGAAHGCTCTVLPEPIVAVLDAPYSAYPAQWSSHTGPPARLQRMGTVPVYVDSDCQACTASPLRGVSWACWAYVAWRAGTATLLSGLSWL